jgi:hypothetical protein
MDFVHEVFKWLSRQAKLSSFVLRVVFASQTEAEEYGNSG